MVDKGDKPLPNTIGKADKSLFLDKGNKSLFDMNDESNEHLSDRHQSPIDDKNVNVDNGGGSSFCSYCNHRVSILPIWHWCIYLIQPRDMVLGKEEDYISKGPWWLCVRGCVLTYIRHLLAPTEG